MNIDDNTYELIDAYLQGKLQANHPFVVGLATNTELVEEIEVFKLMQTAVVEHKLSDVQQILGDKRGEFISNNTTNKNWKLWTFIGVILGISSLGLLLINKSETKENKKVTHTEIVQNNSNQPKQFANSTSLENIKKIGKSTSNNSNTKIKSVTPTIINESEKIKNQETAQNSQKIVPDSNVVKVLKPIDKAIETVVKAPDICNNIKLKASIDAERPCIGTSTGNLKIINVRGGQSPYKYSIDGQHFQNENHFENLKDGNYTIILKDANNCISTIYETYSLNAKTCVDFKEYVYNPKFESWEVPVNHEKQGEFSIYNDSGQRIYFHTFGISEKLTWDGHSQSGDVLFPNIYIFTIKYSDGTEEHGKISLVY